MLKKVVNHLKKSDNLIYFWIKILLTKAALRRNAELLIKQGFGNHFEDLKIENLKQSDTVFILASGASINKITVEQWKQIKEKDTLGFNFWVIHDFIPNLYFFELPRDPDRAHMLAEIFSYRQKDYKSTPVILKKVFRHKLDEVIKFLKTSRLEKVFYARTIDISNSGRSYEMTRNIDRLKLFGLIKHGKSKINLLFQQKASLSYLTLLCYMMGYKQIVLCGVDLNNVDYFYEHEKYNSLPFKIPQSGHENRSKHKTIEKKSGEMNIVEVLSLFQSKIFDKREVQIYVANKSSLLYPYFPCYFDKN